MASTPSKRKSEGAAGDTASKKRKNWQTTSQNRRSKDGDIHPGDAGIWVTCERGREGRCAAEILDLFNDYASRLYPDASSAQANDDGGSEDEASDIEKAISSEIKGMKTAKTTSLFKVVRLNIACIVFVKTRKPIDPVDLVHSICKDIATGAAARKYRVSKRLTPATKTGKAYEENYDNLAREVLKPTFHDDTDASSKKFAIQFTSRNHHVLSRDDVIKRTAVLVGAQHKVDLKNPDFVVLVDVFEAICTMSVVSGEYLALKRYNLSELVGNTREGMDDEASSRVAQSSGALPRQPRSAEDKEEEPVRTAEI